MCDLRSVSFRFSTPVMVITGRVYNMGPVEISYRVAISTVPEAGKH